MKTTKFLSIIMMLVFVLGTTMAFSSCSKDGDNNEIPTNAPIIFNGKSYVASGQTYSSTSSKGANLKIFFKDDSFNGEIEVKFSEQSPSGSVTADEIEVQLEYVNASGKYKGEAKNVPCNFTINGGILKFELSNLKVTLKDSSTSKTMDGTLSVNYTGILL